MKTNNCYCNNKVICIYPMILYINLPLIFDIEIHVQSLMNLVYGSHLVHEIIPYNSTIYKLNNILYITQMRKTNVN